MLPLLGAFTPLVEVQRAAYLPSILGAVRSALCLPKELEKTRVAMSWRCDPYYAAPVALEKSNQRAQTV